MGKLSRYKVTILGKKTQCFLYPPRINRLTLNLSPIFSGSQSSNPQLMARSSCSFTQGSDLSEVAYLSGG